MLIDKQKAKTYVTYNWIKNENVFVNPKGWGKIQKEIHTKLMLNSIKRIITKLDYFLII